MNQNCANLLNRLDTEESYKLFKQERDRQIKKLKYIDEWVSENTLIRNSRNFKHEREKLLENINAMNLNIKKWKDFNVPKREQGSKKLPELI